MLRTKSIPVCRLIGTTCSLMTVLRRPRRYSQPPVKPARLSPATRCGQRPRVEQLPAVDLLPLVGRAEGGVALRRQRVRRRPQPEEVQQQPLVVVLVAVGQEAGLRPPAVGERRPAASRPVPVGPAVERISQATYRSVIRGMAPSMGGS